MNFEAWAHSFFVAVKAKHPEVVAYLTTGDLPRDAERAAQRALALPNRLSPPRSAVDAGGAPCTVLDAAFHPSALAAGENFRPLKMFTAQLALGEAERALGRQLDPSFKLPKMRAFRGGPAPMAFLLEATVGAAVQEAVHLNDLSLAQERARHAQELALADTEVAAGRLDGMSQPVLLCHHKV